MEFHGADPPCNKHPSSSMLPNESHLHAMNKHGISPSQARQLNVLNRSQSLLQSSTSSSSSSSKKQPPIKSEEGSMYYDPRHNTLHQWALRYTLGNKQMNDNIKVITKKEPVPLKRTKSVLKRAQQHQPPPSIPQIHQPNQYPTTTTDLLLPEDVIDDYKIIKCIGRGSFANVYSATNTNTSNDNNLVAIKVVLNHAYVLDLNDDLDAHVQHELSIWRTLHHPNILPLINVLYTNEAVFLIMELMHGNLLDFLKQVTHHASTNKIHRRNSVIGDVRRPQTSWQVGSTSDLTALLSIEDNSSMRPTTSSSNPQDWFQPHSATNQRQQSSHHLFPSSYQEPISSQNEPSSLGGLNEQCARALFIQISNAVQYLHSQSILHNDLKLDNILITRYNDLLVPKISDFGLSINMNHQLQQLQTVINEIDDILQSVTPISTTNKSYGSLPRLYPQSDIHPNLQTYLNNCPIYNESRATGSLEYCAPEELCHSLPLIDDYINHKIKTKPNQAMILKYLQGVDTWGLGVICYSLLSGMLPFMDDFEPRLIRKIMYGEYTELTVDEESMVDYELQKLRLQQFHNPPVIDVVQKIKDKSNESLITIWAQLVVKGLLTTAWYDRMTMDELIKEPWLQPSPNDSNGNSNGNDYEMVHLLVSRSRSHSEQPLHQTELWKDFPNSKSSGSEIIEIEQVRKKSIFDYPSYDSNQS